jgi:ferredoxin
MAKFKIIYNPKGCIGAGECEVLSRDFWKVNNKGKAELKGAVLNPTSGNYELELDDTQHKLQEKVAGSCPGGCIRLQKL